MSISKKLMIDYLSGRSSLYVQHDRFWSSLKNYYNFHFVDDALAKALTGKVGNDPYFKVTPAELIQKITSGEWVFQFNESILQIALELKSAEMVKG